MKRILMAMLVAGMLAVAIPFAPVQVEEAEARPDCQARVVDRNQDNVVSGADLDDAATGPGNSASVHVGLVATEIGTDCNK